MTTIVAVQTGDDVLLGWDGRVTRSNEKYDDLTTKVFVKKGVIYACAGITRLADLIQYADFPEYDGGDARRWIVQVWVPVLRDLIAGDPALYDHEDGSLEQSGILLVVDGEVFHFDSLLSPTTVREGIYGLGSGSDYAKGVLHYLKKDYDRDNTRIDGDDVMEALEVAAIIDPFTGGTLTVTTATALIRSEAF